MGFLQKIQQKHIILDFIKIDIHYHQLLKYFVVFLHLSWPISFSMSFYARAAAKGSLLRSSRRAFGLSKFESKRSFFSGLSTVSWNSTNNVSYEKSVGLIKRNGHQHTSYKHLSSSSDVSTNTFRGYDLSSPESNLSQNIASRVGTNLHLKPKHPLNTIKKIIEDYWESRNGFTIRDNMDPVVPTANNFDSLLIPPDHVSRSMSDTYYLDKETVLRTHTSAHQTTLLNEGYDRFLVTGDVYR